MHPYLARHVVYPVLQWKAGGRVRPLLSDLEKSQWYHAEHLRELQWDKLRALLQHAYGHVPHYRALFDRCGLRPQDLRGIDDLRRLPVLTKEQVRDHPDDLRADNITGPLVERRTSGSTGIPVAIHVYPYTCDSWSAAALRVQRWWGLDIGMRELKLVNPHGKSKSTLLKQYWLMNHGEYSVFDLDGAALDRLYRRVIHSRCEVLSGYPSALTYFAQHVRQKGRPGEMRLKAVMTTAEFLYPDHRALLQRVFGCPVINEYGTSECGHLAGECPSGSLHITAENILLEFEPLEPSNGDDTRRELVITDLTNFAMPMIRYRIGDLGAPGLACSCGRSLPVLDLRAGRTEDLVVLPDGRRIDGAVFGTAVEELTRQGVAVKQFRAIQHAPDHIEVLVAVVDPTHQALRTLQEQIQSLFGARLTVAVTPVDHIPVEPTGKLRRFVSLVKTGDGNGRREGR